MVGIDVPGWKRVELEHLVLDVNGTIASGGRIIPGVREVLAALSEHLCIHAITADTHGTAAMLGEQLAVRVHVIARGQEAEQKLAFIEWLGASSVVAVGNGANDRLMLERAAVGICVIGAEGAATRALMAADVVVTDILDGLALLTEPARLAATLRA